MAANQAEGTMFNEGEENAQQGKNLNTIDINQWLVKNRLTKLSTYFAENEIVADDLLSYDDNDIDSVLSDTKITAHAFKKKFKQAVHKLQDQSHSFNPIQNTIIISTKEAASRKCLEQKLSEISIALQNNTKSINDSIKKTQKQRDEIESAFKSYREALKRREKALGTMSTEQFNQQLETLNAQKDKLTGYQEKIKIAQKTQHALLTKSNLGSEEREIKMEQITKAALQNINDDHMELNPSAILFVVDSNSVTERISNIGAIVYMLNPPVLFIRSVDAMSASFDIQYDANQSQVECDIRYRVKSAEDDDDTKLDDMWFTTFIAQDQNKYTLTELQSDAEYEVQCRCKMLKGSIWSKYSSIVTFNTEKQDCPLCMELISKSSYVKLECCGLLLHLLCLRQFVKNCVKSGHKISLNQLSCFVCKNKMEIADRNEIFSDIDALYNKLRTTALQQLIYDNKTNDDAIVNKDSEFYNNPEGYAMNQYSFFICFKCKAPYFAGDRSCVEEIKDDTSPGERLCSLCAPAMEDCENTFASILKAVNGLGVWLCPNNHIYFVGNCWSNTNQSERCWECQQPIGNDTAKKPNNPADKNKLLGQAKNGIIVPYGSNTCRYTGIALDVPESVYVYFDPITRSVVVTTKIM